MPQNGQTHFKNLAANAARLLSVSNHFGTLCIKGLIGKPGILFRGLLRTSQTSKMKTFAEMGNGWKLLSIFAKKRVLRCLTGFSISSKR